MKDRRTGVENGSETLKSERNMSERIETVQVPHPHNVDDWD